MVFPYGKEIMIVGRTMWAQPTSDRHRQTDITMKDCAMHSVAHSRGKNNIGTFWFNEEVKYN